MNITMARVKIIENFERIWDTNRTPPWFKEFPDKVAEIYQTAREGVILEEGQKESEFNQQMFYHRLLMASVDFLGEDLHRTKTILSSCLESYNKIPQDDRNYSLDVLSNNVKEELAEIDEDVSKHESRLHGSSCKEYVEICLTLGKIKNNNDLLQQLKKCSGEDRKQLEQLLWCMQLVRLIITLEEAALSQTFHQISIPAENETCLARAYHLAKHGKPSDNHSKRVGTNQTATQECVFYGGAKERVRAKIYSEVVLRKYGLEQVKLTIQREAGKELSITDAVFVEDEFRVLCLEQCLEEMQHSMKSYIMSYQEIDIVKMFNFVEIVSTCNAIPHFFKEFDYFKELLKLKLSEEEDSKLVEHFKSTFVNQIIDHCNAVENELGFISSLASYLSKTRKVKAVVNRLGVNEHTLNIDFEKLMTLKDSENYEELLELQSTVKSMMQKETQLIMKDKLHETILGFAEPVTVQLATVDDRTVVKVVGKHVVLGEILESVETGLAIDMDITEVHFIGSQVFHIDADLVSDIWHGKNVVVRSKLIQVHGTVVWDVSGKSCNRKYKPAPSATVEGGDGRAGEDGYPGESGGNVFIMTEKMINCEEFTVISNGGDGSDGQDGGHGKKGRDGVGIKREKLEQEFKSPVRFLAFNTTRMEAAQRMIESIDRNFVYSSQRVIQDSETFIAASGLDGQGVIFSYCSPKIFQNNSHCYIVHKGSLGKSGGQGGDYGRGGEGGFPGQIIVKSAIGEIFNVNKSTVRGQNGRSGAAGLYGDTGDNGWDSGYLDYQTWRSAYYYGEDYKSKLAVTYHDDSRSESVWCWYKNKYASITVVKSENTSVKTYKKRHFGQRDRNHSAVAVMKKTIVESAFIASTDQHFGSIDENALLSAYTRIERIRLRALQGATEKIEQRKKSNKRHRINHIIACPDIEHDIYEPSAKISNTVRQKAMSSKVLENIVIRRESMVNWKQLRFCRIEYQNLRRLFLLLDSIEKEKTNLSANDFKIIEQILVDKQRLITFEAIANKIHKDYSNTDKSVLSAQYASICLEEDPQQCGINWHDDLGTLDDFLFKFDCEDQQQKLSLYCKEYRKKFPSSVVEAFLNEAESADIFIQTHLDQHKLVSELQEFDSARNLNQFMKELVPSKFSNIINLWYLNDENSSLAQKLIHEIDYDYRLCSLRKRCMKDLNKEINLNQCLQNEHFFETYRTSIVKKGPLTRSYRELLAYAFGVNIQVYIRVPSGKFSLLDSHNSESSDIVYLLLENNSFVKLRLNENLMNLENDHRIQARRYSLITGHLMAFKDKQSLDEYISNGLYLYCDFVSMNDVHYLCNTELLNEVIKHFSLGERHVIENMFSRSDVSSFVYSKLLRNICLRFAAEGKHISTDEVHFMVNRYLVACSVGRHEEDIVSWIVLAFPQVSWVSEILLLDLERYYKERLARESEWRILLKSVENRAIMILFSAKLELSPPGTVEPIDKMDRILKMMSMAKIQTATLQKLDLSEWYYVLEEQYWVEKLKSITSWRNDNETLQEASYYAVALLNNYSLEIMEKFFNTIKGNNVSENDIINVLCSVYNGRWNLTEEKITYLEKIKLDQWIKHMDSNMSKQQERNINDVVQLIEDNKWACLGVLSKLKLLTKQVLYIKEEIDKRNRVFRNVVPYLYNRLRERLPGAESTSSACFSDKRVEEQLLDIDDAIYEEFEFRLRDTQKFVVLTLLENNKNTLAQVSTGEGKSLIVVAVAIIKASQGQKVDIITSSSVLARRDAEQSKSIYAKFGINVSHNCSEDIEKRKEAYSGNQVVYGDLSSFQRDYLLHKFYQKNVLGDRDFVNVIVDEVDSMLLDRGNNMLYLSHDLPDMDKLESVYVFIWQWVNNSSNGFDSTIIRDAVLWQIYGVLKCTDIGKIDATLSEEERNFIWNKLVEAKIIDGDGKLMTENINNDVLGNLLGSEYSIYLDRLEYLLMENINREKCIHVPNYLRSFVDLHLESWIEAAKTALVMEAGHDYVVDVDRSGSSADRTPNITILDKDTGTDLVNSQWEAALHQFVQLKHGCKTYLQSLKAVFISNVTFFKLYDKLYGLSGTLGSHRERDLLEEIYAVDFVNVPTAKCKQFYEDVPIVCKSAADWTDTIIKSTKWLTETDGRSVLIICETLNEVAKLYKEFGGKNAINVRTYTREYEEFDIGELPSGQIIIATNLAGRGTDIKLTRELKDAGGVHVCLTYLPSNIRVEQQAFGRAARCGDWGSGQLIVLDQKEILNIMLLKRQRDTRELGRISLIKKHYETRVVLEENCFRQFTQQFDGLRNLLTTSKVTNGKEELSDILLGSCLDRWVFWLDSNGKNLVSNAKHHSRKKLDSSLEDFLNHLKSLNVTSHKSLLDWVDISTPRMIKLGRYFIENKQTELAHTLFEKVIATEPQFSEAALYYKAYALSTNITWNVVNSPEVKTFSHTLRSAADLFEERVQNLMINVSRVDKIKTNFKHNILPITAYKEQKQIICKFYGALTQSVNDILGHPVTATSFEVGDTIDKSRSIEIFNALQARQIVQNPIIKDNITEGELRDICFNYGTSAAELLNFLESCRKNQGRSVQLEKFVRLLKEQVKLPSREGFWRHLVEQEILSNEEKYIVVDKTKLSFTDMEYFDSKQSVLGLKSKVTTKVGDLLLYPDQLLNEDAYNKVSFKKAVDPAKYSAFKEMGAISFQRKAKFNIEKLKTKQVNFNRYDSVSLVDFAMINISQNDANGILDLLARNKVLKKQNGSEELYRLRTDGSKINGIQLGEYKIYEDAVRGLLNLCFCYRIAYQSITGFATNGRSQDVPLISKPHRRILADLLYARILEPAKVVSSIADIGGLRMILSGIRLEEGSLVQIAQRLKSLKGSMDYLKTVPFSEYDRYTNVEEWNLFSLNGNELLLKLRGASFMKIVGTFLWGTMLIGCVLVQNINTRGKALFRQDSTYTTGWQYICSAIRMAFDVYGTDYYKLKYNNFIKRVARFEAASLGFFGDRLNKFAFEVTQPATSKPAIQYVRKLAVPLIRGVDLVSRTANVQLLIDDHLKVMCTERSDCLLSSIDNNEAFSIFEECLKKLLRFMTVDEVRIKLDKLTEMHLQRQQNFKNIEAIFGKMADTVLQALTKATKRPNVHITISTILSVDINDAWVTALKDNERNLAMIVTKIIQELSGKLDLLIDENSVEDQTAITGCEGFVEEAILYLKEQLHEKLEVLLQQNIHRPVQERGRFLLLNYVEGQIELQTDSADGPSPREDFARKIRIGQLKNESRERRQALAMTPVENLLDQQFNAALAKWEQNSTELGRLAVCIRKGEPVDGQYLAMCLDAVRFVLLRRAEVVSNICINQMTDGKTRKKISSPRNFNGIAMDLHLMDNKFLVGTTQKPSGKFIRNSNCLYDCLLEHIFELRSISSKQFALEISQHLVNVLGNKSNPEPTLKNFLDFNKPSTFKELCFAQFLNACFECPARGVVAFGDLMERAKNGPKYALDWHGTGFSHVQAVTIHNSKRFVEAGFKRNATTDTIFGKVMYDLREAFFKVYQ